ncbi:MAG: hypothetical protein VX094_02470 [Bacteroidota bacterium]|nr:hypothetical protein [Bacteroidota bacterium]
MQSYPYKRERSRMAIHLCNGAREWSLEVLLADSQDSMMEKGSAGSH